MIRPYYFLSAHTHTHTLIYLYIKQIRIGKPYLVEMLDCTYTGVFALLWNPNKMTIMGFKKLQIQIFTRVLLFSMGSCYV